MPIFIFLYFHFQTIRVLIAFLIVAIPLCIYLFFFLKRQNIKSLELAQNKLLVSYKKHKIEIPISQIQDIIVGISMGFDLKFNIIKTYTILLNKKYLFGNKLFVDYKIDKYIEISNKEEPISIKVLKIEMQKTVNI